MNYKEALDTMCRRCENYTVCEGTGCEPKKTLTNAINDAAIFAEFVEDVTNDLKESINGQDD